MLKTMATSIFEFFKNISSPNDVIADQIFHIFICLLCVTENLVTSFQLPATAPFCCLGNIPANISYVYINIQPDYTK